MATHYIAHRYNDGKRQSLPASQWMTMPTTNGLTLLSLMTVKHAQYNVVGLNVWKA